jgi:hypothetical protein
MPQTEVQKVLQTRYLLQVGNGTGARVYLFPQSVKHMHPEFDQAVEVILKVLLLPPTAIYYALRELLPARLIPWQWWSSLSHEQGEIFCQPLILPLDTT